MMGNGVTGMQKLYETERLILKTLDSSYASMVADYYLRNKSFLAEWISLREAAFYTREFQEKQLEKELIDIANNFSLRLWIFDKRLQDNIIGTIAFNDILWGAHLSCQIGYRLDKDNTGKGYMAEAAKKGIDIMFNEYKLHRIEANILPNNKPSLKLAGKLGFTAEGIAREYLKVNGKWQDHLRFVLLNKI